MKSKLLQWFAIVLILEIGMLHIMTAQNQYDAIAYMGYLFAANFFGSLIAAFGIYHKQLWGWTLGAVIAIGSIVGYLWSCTFGLPGLNIQEWWTPYGVVSVTVEALFTLVILLRPWKIQASELLPTTNSRLRYIWPVVSLLIVASLSTFTQQWNYQSILHYGHHVGSLGQVCNTPITTMAQLEDKYGVKVSLVANSMMNSIVDVRLTILDPDKAHNLLQNQAALLLNQDALFLAPHLHSHGGNRLKVGKQFIIFFPTKQLIHPGSSVSLVFGSVRVEPVIVR